MRIEVLGTVRALRDDGEPIALRGPRHREVLARLIVADGRMVTIDALVDDLWTDPPPGAVGALRTFVAALRRALEPERPPRSSPRLLVTEGAGYALRLPREAVDARYFEDAVAAARQRSSAAVTDLEAALTSWRGPGYADLADHPWLAAERARLEDLRLEAVELRAALLLDAGRGQELVAELTAHVSEHPWREPAWALLARALYRAGRQVDALTALRRGRAMLIDQLGIDPAPDMRRLETQILRHAPELAPHSALWVPASAGPRTTAEVARVLALTGGQALVRSRRDRLAAALAAERSGDVAVTARVIGAYDVPAIWNRADDFDQAREVVAVAERNLARLGPDGPIDLRARLHATIAIESRADDARDAALTAEKLARAAGDPVVLAYALNAVFLQSFDRPGRSRERDAVGGELTELATAHRLPAFAVLGHLMRLQSASAIGDFESGARHAEAADRIARDHELPVVGVFTQWFRALVTAVRSAEAGGPSAAEAAAAYRAADAALEGAGMPGVHRGLLPLALLGLRLMHGRRPPTDQRLDWGPYAAWSEPLVLIALGRRGEARNAVRSLPDPPHDHLQEALLCLEVHAAEQLGEWDIAERAAEKLQAAEQEHAGAASGMLTVGPVRRYRAAVVTRRAGGAPG